MTRFCLRLTAIVCLFITASQAWAAFSVNIDFGPTPNHPGGPTSTLYSGTAAAPVAGTVWNELLVVDNNAFHGPPGEFGFWTSNVTKSGLVDSLGAVTALSVTAVAAPPEGTGTFGILQTAPNLGAVATDAVNLMRDYLIGFGGAQKVTLSGFAPGTPVDLYLYGAGDTNNRDTVFSVTDVNGTHSATTTGTLTTDGNNPVAHTLTLGGDYVVLNDVFANASGIIDILYDNGAGSGEAPFNGLQAVYDVFSGVTGDVNGDGFVTNADYLVIRNNFRLQGATRAQGDITSPVGGNFGDGIVDFYDFVQWQEAFTGSGAAAGSAVPEPTSIVMALVFTGACGLSRRFRA